MFIIDSVNSTSFSILDLFIKKAFQSFTVISNFSHLLDTTTSQFLIEVVSSLSNNFQFS
ncbi:MAG: hypothetical protein WCG25_07175 [bacterium]